MDHNVDDDDHEILVPGVTIWKASKTPSISDFPSRVTSIDHDHDPDDVSYNGAPSFSDFPSRPHSEGYWELIFGQLDLGPDDFAIPAADYEALRASYSARVSYSSPVLVTNDLLENDDKDLETRRLYSIRELPKTDEIAINNWQKGEIIGRGSLGTVYEGVNEFGFFFAVKEVSLLDQGSQGKQSISQLKQEISLLSQFHHENIVRYLGTDTDDGKLYIFLELVTKGSLANLYQMYVLRDSQVSVYTRQILSGLNYLHERKVVHGDIKCANILVDANGSVKLTDFGLAKATTLNDIKSCKGTPYLMAPEVVNNQANKGYGLAADIWSLGCTVLEMLTRKIPYYHLEGMQALFRIGMGELPEIPNTLSTEAQDFILKCLQVNPNDRPIAAQLLEHPFVKRPADTVSYYSYNHA